MKFLVQKQAMPLEKKHVSSSMVHNDITMIMCLRYVIQSARIFVNAQFPSQVPNMPNQKLMERLIRVHSPLVGKNTSKKRPFRRSLAASWDSKRRSLEEDFARKEQELRSEQVPKTAWKGWWSQNLTDLYHPPKKDEGM